MYIFRKYKNPFALAVRQTCQSLTFLPVSIARTNKFYISRQCTYIVY